MLPCSAIGRLVTALALLFLCTTDCAPAAAHSHVVLGFGFSYYAPGPYYYPPYYYYPPPVYYAPPVVYYSAPPASYVAPSPTCRTFQGDATNDQTHQPFYGTACLWPDGKWRITN